MRQYRRFGAESGLSRSAGFCMSSKMDDEVDGGQAINGEFTDGFAARRKAPVPQ